MNVSATCRALVPISLFFFSSRSMNWLICLSHSLNCGRACVINAVCAPEKSPAFCRSITNLTSGKVLASVSLMVANILCSSSSTVPDDIRLSSGAADFA